MKHRSSCIHIILVLIILLVLPLQAVSAQETDPPPGAPGDALDSALEPVTALVRDVALSIIKFITFLGGVIFVITVVVGAARGTLGTALGNQMQASQGVMALIMGGAALVLMLVAVPLANNLLEMLVEKLLTPEAMVIPDIVSLAGSPDAASSSPEDLLQIPALQNMITDIALVVVRVMITLGSTAFVVSVMLGALDTQIGHLFGGGMLASRGIMRIITSVGAVALLILSFPLSKWILNALVPLILPTITLSTPF